MAQLFGQKMEIVGRLLNKDGSLFFLGLGKEVQLLQFAAKRLSNLSFENVEATLSLKVSFHSKPAKGGPHKINTSKLEDSDIVVNSINVLELNAVLENFNMFSPQSEDLKELVILKVNSELINGRYDDLLEMEGKPYSESEELIALKIYALTRGGDYGDMMAMVKDQIETGEIHRSVDSLEMKVNTYKSLDKDSGVSGLEATSVTSRELWKKYEDGEIQF